MKPSTLAFMVLCVVTPAVQLLERYGLSHWQDAVVAGLILLGMVLMVMLLIWSIWNIRRNFLQAIAGSLVCSYCIWQSFQNGKIIY